MRKIRVVHYGIEHAHSSVTMECARKYTEIFDIVGVVEPDEAVWLKHSGAAAYQGVPRITEEQLFSRCDVDAVLVESDELRSVADAAKCINHGLHVHLDKPAGLSAQHFESVLRDAKRQGLTVQLGYMYRFNPAVRYCIQAVKDGKLGDITSIDGSMGCTYGKNLRQWLERFPGGMMFFLGCHFVDLVYAIWGVPEHIIPYSKCSGVDVKNAADNAFVVFEYPNGTAAIRVNSVEINGYNRRNLTVCGTKGTIEIRPMECPTRMYETISDGSPNWTWKDRKIDIDPGFIPGRYDAMMLDFAACVRGEKENEYSYEYEAQLHRLVLSACGVDIDYKERGKRL
ncbi:hypothetical protein AGMMS49992_25080 [Clostridia bacterium]|nr:hypothetical protein AGMMS49992_25080 [Clostridia bacterium]